ncbi:Major facilitator super domain-containing protein 12, partial [Blomia tropicalis]
MNSNIKSMSLDCKSKYSFGLGHVQNDICATIWFTYTMLFYKLSYDGDSYLFVVIGQIFDAIITIIVGLTFNCSLTNSEFFSLGKQAMSIYGAIVVNGLFWFTLQSSKETCLSRKDVFIFSNNIFLLSAFGFIHSAIFLLAFNEKRLIQIKTHYLATLNTHELVQVDDVTDTSVVEFQPCRRPMDEYKWSNWFYDLTFYKINSIATVPLIIFISGFMASFFSNYVESKYGNKHDLLFGVLIGIAASMWTVTGDCNNQSFKSFEIYLIAILFGISTSIVKISTISLVSDMIGMNEKSISFIYGAVSFFERICGGIVIYILERFNEKSLSLKTCDQINEFNITKQSWSTTIDDLL